jgi:hypothetical protein
MLLTTAVIAVAPGAALPFARLLGVAAGAASLVLVFFTTLHLLPNRRAAVPAALTASALLATASGYALNSVSGLETLLFAALIALGTALSARDAGRVPASALAFGAAALTRPEGLFLFAVFWLARALGDVDAFRRRALVRDAFVVAVLVALHLAFRIRVYDGEWLPNTYYAKAGGAGDTTPLTYIQGSLRPLLGIPGVAVGLLGGLLEDRRARAPFDAISAAAAALPFLTGPDWMPGGRLLIPALVLLAPVAVTGWVTLLDRASPRLALGVPLLLVPSVALQAASRDAYVEIAAFGPTASVWPAARWPRRSAQPRGRATSLRSPISARRFRLPEPAHPRHQRSGRPPDREEPRSIPQQAVRRWLRLRPRTALPRDRVVHRRECRRGGARRRTPAVPPADRGRHRAGPALHHPLREARALSGHGQQRDRGAHRRLAGIRLPLPTGRYLFAAYEREPDAR